QQLAPHFKEEEEIVFAVLAADDPMKSAALAQHEELRHLVVGLEKEEGGSQARLADFANKLDMHIRYEERELFPYIEGKLSGAQLQEMEMAINEIHHKETAPEWHDPFWQKDV